MDNSEANDLTAEELGFISIHFSSPEQLQVKLEGLGVLNFDEVALSSRYLFFQRTQP